MTISEIAKRHIGKGIVIIDPKIVEENNLLTGQILELIGNKKVMLNYGLVHKKILWNINNKNRRPSSYNI